MAKTKYSFPITDFPNHKVDSNRFTQEIQTSAITKALDYMDTSDTDCDVWFKVALSGSDETVLDELVAAHSGEPLAPQQPVDPEGAPYVSLLPGKPGRKLCVTGIKFDASADGTTNNDKTFSDTREIQGAWLEVAGFQVGDYVELFVCMPDGTPVGQFGETVYIPPSGKVDQIVSEGTVSFPSGFKLRMAYIAVSAGTTRTVYGWYRMRK